MSGPTPPPENKTSALIRNYAVLCIGALAVMLMTLLQRGWGYVALVPVVVGALALLARWQSAPVLLLAFLGGVQMMPWARYFGWGDRGQPITDALLCAATLGFVVAHYRLASLLRGIIPEDTRTAALHKSAARFMKRGPKGHGELWLDPATLPRSAEHAGDGEIQRLLYVLPLWVLFGLAAWAGLRRLPPQFGFYGTAWRVTVLAWIVGVGTIALRTVFAYLRYRHMSRGEALLCLQDIVWRETRREQGRLWRWLAWGQRRRRIS